MEMEALWLPPAALSCPSFCVCSVPFPPLRCFTHCAPKPPLSLAPRRFELWNKGLRHAAASGNTTAAPAANGTGDNSTSDGGAGAAAGSGCSSCGGHFSTEEERAAAAAAAAKRAAPIQLASAATRLAPADAETRRPARLSLSPRVGARQRSH